jgi:hypothetical protein
MTCQLFAPTARDGAALGRSRRVFGMFEAAMPISGAVSREAA